MEPNRPGDNFRSREHALFLILNRENASRARNYSLRSTFHADADFVPVGRKATQQLCTSQMSASESFL
jgi:hypothetical protein